MEFYRNLVVDYQPKNKIKLLFIAESPPYPNEEHPLPKDRRYFYNPNTTKYDILFQEMTKIFLSTSEQKKDKHEKLKELQKLGIFLIDACEIPINHIKPPNKRKRIIKDNIDGLLERLQSFRKDSLIDKTTPIILLTKNVYCVVLPYLLLKGYNVLNTKIMEYINFPRKNVISFREKLKTILKAIDWNLPEN